MTVSLNDEKIPASHKAKKSKFLSKQWITAAMIALVLVSVAAFNSKTIIAAVAKLFGFVPGVGIVESNNDGENDLFILDNMSDVFEDEMVKLTLNDAFTQDGELILRYTVYLSEISDKDLKNNINSLSDLYIRLGYDKYFSISEESPILTPHTSATVNGIELTAKNTTVTESESIESARTICISQHYDISDAVKVDTLAGTISLGDIKAEFCMKKIEFDTSEHGASGGIFAEADGVKILCVPTLNDQTLYIDYYAYDLGGYKSTTGFRGRYKTDTLTVNEKEIEGETDESYLFSSEGSTHIGNRIKYDLSHCVECTEAVITASGIFAEKEYNSKGIFFDKTPDRELAVNETVSLDGIDITISKVCYMSLGEEDGYENSSYGYLSFDYSALSSDACRFIDFNNISINGENVESFYVGFGDGEYKNVAIPLTIPYDDIRSIEFDSALLLLNSDITVKIPLK